MSTSEDRSSVDALATGGLLQVGGSLVGLFGGGWLGSELGQVVDFLVHRASADSSTDATPHVEALRHSLAAAAPAGVIGGIIGFLVTAACIGRGRTVSGPFIGLAAAGAAGAIIGLSSGSN